MLYKYDIWENISSVSASSASFDGTGNIEHDLYSLNSTMSENISFAFYTDQ